MQHMKTLKKLMEDGDENTIWNSKLEMEKISVPEWQAEVPEWRYKVIKKCAEKRSSELTVDKFIDMLSLPAKMRDHEAIVEHMKSVSENKDSVNYLLQKWIDHSTSSTVKYLLETIDVAMSDEEADASSVDKEKIEEMLGIFAKLEEIKPREELKLSKDDIDLLEDAKDLIGR